MERKKLKSLTRPRNGQPSPPPPCPQVLVASYGLQDENIL